MRHVVGGVGRNGKVVYDSSRKRLHIWQKGWIGKRKYRINLSDVQAVMFGIYTTRIRLPMIGFNIEFVSKGKPVVVTIPGDGKKIAENALSVVRTIGTDGGLVEYDVGGGGLLYSRSVPETGVVAKKVPPMSDGLPMTKGEELLAGASRGAKNIASEVVSDAKNATIGFGKGLMLICAVIAIIGIVAAAPPLGVLLAVAGLMIYRRRS
jgi:hypothetical protein